jgi:hypothetical protein
MATGSLPVERLRGYLRQLPPASRNLLIAELERALLRGDELPGGDLLLQELRSVLRESGQQASRIAAAARLFFKPLEPYLVDDDPEHKHPARIARSLLRPIWDWICRDLLAEEAKSFTETVERALASGGSSAAELGGPFQDRVCERVSVMLAEGRSDDKARRRMIGQIGIPMALENLGDLSTILASRHLVALLEYRLPAHVRNFADAQLDDVKALIDACTLRQRELTPYALVLVMGHLASPWQLIRLAVKAAESDEVARVAATSYASAVTITLADVERMVRELKDDLRLGGAVAVTSLLKCIHDAVRGLRSELDLAADSLWGRQLAAIRAEVSGALRTEIESTPGRVRRLLRPRAAGKSTPGALDPNEVAETESLIELLGACRQYAGELAVNEVTLRASAELQKCLDTGTQTLLDGLRSGEPAERPFRQSQVDAAVRFCGKVFGAEYAALLGKAAEVAGSGERKALPAASGRT